DALRRIAAPLHAAPTKQGLSCSRRPPRPHCEGRRSVRPEPGGPTGAALPARLRPRAQSRRVRLESPQAPGRQQEAPAPRRIPPQSRSVRPRPHSVQPRPGALLLSCPKCSLYNGLISKSFDPLPYGSPFALLGTLTARGEPGAKQGTCSWRAQAFLENGD